MIYTIIKRNRIEYIKIMNIAIKIETAYSVIIIRISFQEWIYTYQFFKLRMKVLRISTYTLLKIIRVKIYSPRKNSLHNVPLVNLKLVTL